jgi:molybdopterin-guanine dinucleotide biosynthesis protein A
MDLPEITPKVAGLLLAGGKSSRMGVDKANLVYPPRTIPQWRHGFQLLADCCDDVYLSVRSNQNLEGWEQGLGTLIADNGESEGPLSGMCAAASRNTLPLLVVACDLPLLDGAILRTLLAARDGSDCVAYRSSTDGLPEPLCALYEPAFFPIWEQALGSGQRCPRKLLMQNASRVRLLDLERPDALDNANSPEDFARLTQQPVIPIP